MSGFNLNDLEHGDIVTFTGPERDDEVYKKEYEFLCARNECFVILEIGTWVNDEVKVIVRPQNYYWEIASVKRGNRLTTIVK